MTIRVVDDNFELKVRGLQQLMADNPMWVITKVEAFKISPLFPRALQLAAGGPGALYEVGSQGLALGKIPMGWESRRLLSTPEDLTAWLQELKVEGVKVTALPVFL